MSSYPPFTRLSASNAPRSVSKLLTAWHTIECWVAVICFAFIASILVIDVVYRELLSPLLVFLGLSNGSGGIFGAQKLAIFALVVGAFAGIGIATATGSHLIPRIGFKWFPRRYSELIDRASDIFTGMVMLACAWYGLQFALVSKEFGVIAPVINTSPWVVQLAIALGFLSAGLRYFIFAKWPSTRPVLPEYAE